MGQRLTKAVIVNRWLRAEAEETYGNSLSRCQSIPSIIQRSALPSCWVKGWSGRRFSQKALGVAKTESKALKMCQLLIFSPSWNPAELSKVGNGQEDQLWADSAERRRPQDVMDPGADKWWAADSGNSTGKSRCDQIYMSDETNCRSDWESSCALWPKANTSNVIDFNPDRDAGNSQCLQLFPFRRWPRAMLSAPGSMRENERKKQKGFQGFQRQSQWLYFICSTNTLFFYARAFFCLRIAALAFCCLCWSSSLWLARSMLSDRPTLYIRTFHPFWKSPKTLCLINLEIKAKAINVFFFCLLHASLMAMSSVCLSLYTAGCTDS